ncbi:MAG TPA: hypothetical protein VLS51_06050, partial [Propionibacteriaceae bacterium]|nr:hypothetical protein [Propionibacteriaceae bacterium]
MAYLEDQLELLRAGLDPALPVERLAHRELQVRAESLVYVWLADRRPELVEAAEDALDQLLAQQGAHGLFLTGDNLVSPPDSAFTVNGLCRLLRVLAQREEPELHDVREKATHVVQRCRDALVRGGIHTPNHRWEISCALVQLWHLFGWSDCHERAGEWLAEGVDLQQDGLYSERSPIYAVHVSGPCLLDMARLLDRADLADAVHRNLHATIDLVDARDLVETIQSRRQDQRKDFPLSAYGLLYRRVAAATGCGVCAAMAVRAEASGARADVDAVAQVLLDPTIGGLPPVQPPSPPEGWRVLTTSKLAVWQREGLRVVCHASADVARLGRVASGTSADPTFAKVSVGELTLGFRLSRSFFNLGPYRPTELAVEGATVVLHERVESHYYQPLPSGARREDADYDLEFEGRFAAQMAFSKRARDTVSLETAVSVVPRGREVELTIETAGASTSQVLEVAVLGDGDLGRVDGAAELRDPRTAVARGDVALSDGQVSVHVVGELDQQD